MRLALLAVAAFAAAAPRFVAMDDAEIARELRRVHAAQRPFAGRVDAGSERFLGIPYKLEALGEGDAGEFDRDPLMSLRALDCTTFVEEAMALTLEPDLAKAKELLQKIRYNDGRVAFESRNHFTEADWIPNNVRAGFLADVTARVGGDRTRWVEKKISKRDWYVTRSSSDLSGFGDEAPGRIEARVARWRALADKVPDETVRLPYVPLEALADVAANIPTGTIGNVIRESRDDKPTIVSHQFLILQRPGGPIMRHAAFGRQVMDVGLLDYFSRFKDSKWRVLGVNLDAVQGR